MQVVDPRPTANPCQTADRKKYCKCPQKSSRQENCLLHHANTCRWLMARASPRDKRLQSTLRLSNSAMRARWCVVDPCQLSRPTHALTTRLLFGACVSMFFTLDAQALSSTKVFAARPM